MLGDPGESGWHHGHGGSFSDNLNEVLRALRLSMTYDQGMEMMKHAGITQITGAAIYFTDPYRLWHRGSNENTNGLLRQNLAKGTNISVYSQEELNSIADSLNTRPRKTLGWLTPLKVTPRCSRNRPLARVPVNNVARGTLAPYYRIPENTAIMTIALLLAS